MTDQLTMVKSPDAPDATLRELIDRAGALGAEKRRIEEELEPLKRELAARADFQGDCKTAHLLGDSWKATVKLTEYVTWDQKVLEAARGAMGDEAFFKAFKWEFKPLSAKAAAAAMSEFSPWAGALEGARRVSAGSTVSFKPMEDC